MILNRVEVLRNGQALKHKNHFTLFFYRMGRIKQSRLNWYIFETASTILLTGIKDP